jgi:hypothetical protein
MKEKPAAPGRQRLEHTPYLDAWRVRLAAALDGHGIKSDLARFLASQGRRGLASSANLVSQVLAGRMVPNAEDFLAMDHWLALRTAGPRR